MADQKDIDQFFATSAAQTPAPLDPFPKLADELIDGVPLRKVFENYDKKIAEWMKRTQNTLSR